MISRLFRRPFAVIASRTIKDKAGRVMTVGLSEGAVCKLKDLQTHSPGKVLRVAVDSGGCHGLSYSFALVDKKTVEHEDVEFKHNRARVSVIIDTFSLPYLTGCTIDYEQGFMRSAFCVKDNPQASSECGCGSSFDVNKK